MYALPINGKKAIVNERPRDGSLSSIAELTEPGNTPCGQRQIGDP